MLKKDLHLLPAALICILLLWANSFSQTAAAAPDQSKAENSNNRETENLIHIGDLIDVDIIGSTEYDWRGKINPEGFLEGINFIENPIFGLCRSEESVAADIAKGYAKLLRDPQIVVRIIDKGGRPNSYLYGAIKTPHRFSLQRAIYLSELITLAGGITDQASGEIQILRPPKLSCEIPETSGDLPSDPAAQSQKISTAAGSAQLKVFNIKIGDLLRGGREANPLIVNGDVVTVLEADPIYIIGGVLNPKQIKVSAKTTVSRAIAGAGGLTKNADPKNISVFRRTAGGTEIVRVDLDAIKNGEADDLILQRFDVVDVGQAGGESRKIAPIIKTDEHAAKPAELPLRIIN